MVTASDDKTVVVWSPKSIVQLNTSSMYRTMSYPQLDLIKQLFCGIPGKERFYVSWRHTFTFTCHFFLDFYMMVQRFYQQAMMVRLWHSSSGKCKILSQQRIHPDLFTKIKNC